MVNRSTFGLARPSGSFEFTYAEIGLGTTSVTGDIEMALEEFMGALLCSPLQSGWVGPRVIYGFPPGCGGSASSIPSCVQTPGIPLASAESPLGNPSFGVPAWGPKTVSSDQVWTWPSRCPDPPRGFWFNYP